MKNVKNIILISMLLISRSVIAQDERQAKERLETMKIGFITKRLDLTSEEAKVFWPVYNKYSDELEKIRKTRRDNIVNARENFDSMSDSEVEKAVDSEIMFRQNEVEILKKYHPQFKKVLPIKKVARLYKAEEDFKRKLLEMLQERKEGRREDHQNGPKGPPPPMH